MEVIDMSNLVGFRQKPKFSVAIQTDSYKKLVNSTLGDPERSRRFVAAISSAVAVNPALQECDAGTILSAALLGESLNLSPSPQLGQYYMVPYEIKVKDENGKVIYLKDENGKNIKDDKGKWVALTEKRAQFQLGYKGYIQLAIRSGQYKKLNVLPIKQSELINFDPLNEEINVRLIDEEAIREKAETIGYYAMFEYLNGFKKAMYWSFDKMLSHANHYSRAFNKDIYKQIQDGKIPDDEMWKYSSFWYVNFDEMACKTMLRQLISKWGIMSIELQTAFMNDMGVLGQDGTVEYIDNEDIDNERLEIKSSVKAVEKDQESEAQTILSKEGDGAEVTLDDI